jgi:hypothetical protein
VFGEARVFGAARVSGEAQVFGAGALVNIIWKGFNITITPQNIVVGCKLYPRFGKGGVSQKSKADAIEHNIDEDTRKQYMQFIKVGCSIVPRRRAV